MVGTSRRTCSSHDPEHRQQHRRHARRASTTRSTRPSSTTPRRRAVELQRLLLGRALRPVASIWHFARTSALQLVAASRRDGRGRDRDRDRHGAQRRRQPGRRARRRYTITGANPASGAVTTAADGTAAITWTGTEGRDRHADRVRRPRRQRHARRQHRAAADRDRDLDGAAAASAAAGAGQVGRREGRLGPGLHQAPGSGRARQAPGRRRGSCRSRARRTSRSARSWTRARAAWR